MEKPRKVVSTADKYLKKENRKTNTIGRKEENMKKRVNEDCFFTQFEDSVKNGRYNTAKISKVGIRDYTEKMKKSIKNKEPIYWAI